MTHRFGKSNPGLADDFDVVGLAPGRMAEAAKWPDLTGEARTNKPWLDGLPRHIFVGDMADTFSRDVPFNYLAEEVFANVVSDLGRRHQWLWLTKRPGRMAQFSRWLKRRGIAWPTNLWAGTSVTTQSTTSRISKLLEVGNGDTSRFVSVEPQWGPVTLAKWLPRLTWVIQGGHSGGTGHPFDLAWADQLRDECGQYGVAHFLKQLGSRVVESGQVLKLAMGSNGDWSVWPKRLRVRQMPHSSSLLTREIRPRLR
jgi:protein gp37